LAHRPGPQKLGIGGTHLSFEYNEYVYSIGR